MIRVFLFSDIEGSTVRWEAHREAMQEALRRHDDLMRSAIATNGGRVFKTIGDAFCAVFETVPEAAQAALHAQRSIATSQWSDVDGLRVRMAIHTGVAQERDADYFGPTVNRVARLLAIGHGGQILLSGAASDAMAELSPHVWLVDMGVHRLKDLAAAERVHQLCADDLETEFPPLNSLDAAKHNIPEQLTPLVGRQSDCVEIEKLFKRSRLVTLTGCGGVGKTRTAMQVAGSFAGDRDDGVWLVDLSAIDEPARVASAFASVFAVADAGSAEQLLERVAVTLKKKRLLIVLDNCEHVLEAAARAVSEILSTAPEVLILATSRQPLGVSGEEPYRMPSLPEDDALALFVARAQSADRTFAISDRDRAVALSIVRRLGGIALAIELAAARVKYLSLPQLERRLVDCFKILTGGSRTALPRQQTLRALIEWSHDLLDDSERSAFRQCAIFRGEFTLEAVEAVCIDETFPDWDAFDLVSRLVDKSLVVADSHSDGARYRLLEPMRQFALERHNADAQRKRVSARHCTYFGLQAQRAGDAHWRDDSDAWTAAVRPMLENYRAAINWGCDDGNDVEAAANIVVGVRWMWLTHEAIDLIARVRAVSGAGLPPRLMGLLALTEAHFMDSARSLEPAAEAIAALSEGVDDVGYAQARSAYALALGQSGRVDEAIAAFREAVAAARRTAIPQLIAHVVTMAAYWNGVAGNRERAGALFDEAEAINRLQLDLRALAHVQSNRAEFLFAQDDVDGALACAREAQSIYRQRGEVLALFFAVLNAAAYLLALRDYPSAWSAARESLELAIQAGDELKVAVAIERLAQLAAETGDRVRAARLVGYVDEICRRTGIVRQPTEQRGRDRILAIVEDAMPRDTVRSLIGQGEALEQDAAIAEAMGIAQPIAPTGKRRSAPAIRRLPPLAGGEAPPLPQR